MLALLAPFWDWGPSLTILGLLRHLEATALLLAAKLGFLEGKLGMLQLSLAMLCQVEAICQVLFGHVVGFASKYALLAEDQDFKWASASHVGSIAGSSTAILKGWGPSLAILGLLRHLEATALLFAGKLGDLEGKLGDREVTLQLSRAQALFGHVRTKILIEMGVGSIGGSSTAILWVCWHFWHRFGINFWKLELCFLRQSLGILGANWSIGRSCCSYGHVVQFCVQKCSPPAGPRF